MADAINAIINFFGKLQMLLVWQTAKMDFMEITIKQLASSAILVVKLAKMVPEMIVNHAFQVFFCWPLPVSLHVQMVTTMIPQIKFAAQ